MRREKYFMAFIVLAALLMTFDYTVEVQAQSVMAGNLHTSSELGSLKGVSKNKKKIMKQAMSCLKGEWESARKVGTDLSTGKIISDYYVRFEDGLAKYFRYENGELVLEHTEKIVSARKVKNIPEAEKGYAIVIENDSGQRNAYAFQRKNPETLWMFLNNKIPEGLAGPDSLLKVQ